MKKRLICLMMSVLMVLTVCPVSAFADDMIAKPANASDQGKASNLDSGESGRVNQTDGPSDQNFPDTFKTSDDGELIDIITDLGKDIVSGAPNGGDGKDDADLKKDNGKDDADLKEDNGKDEADHKEDNGKDDVDHKEDNGDDVDPNAGGDSEGKDLNDGDGEGEDLNDGDGEGEDLDDGDGEGEDLKVGGAAGGDRE